MRSKSSTILCVIAVDTPLIVASIIVALMELIGVEPGHHLRILLKVTF